MAWLGIRCENTTDLSKNLHRGRARISRILLWLAIGPLLSAQSISQINLSNGLVNISLDAATGSIESIVDVGTGVSFISVPPGTYHPLWELDLDSTSGPRVYANSDASPPTASVSSDATGTVVDLVWRGLHFANGASAPAAVTTVEIRLLTGSRTASFTFHAESLVGNQIKHLRFPGIAGISAIGSGDDNRLLVPEFGGRLFSDPVHQPTGSGIAGFGLQYPGILSMQMMAFYNPKAGLFVASHDVSGQTKFFQWDTDSTTRATGRIEIDHVFPSQPWDSLTLGYECEIGTFQGDWTAAADLYKSWAAGTPWVSSASARTEPTWLDQLEYSRQFCMKDCGDPAWDTNYAAVLQEQSLNLPSFGSPAVLNFSGWEDHPTWYYGDYFPPQGGWAAFDQFVTTLHQQGNYLKVAAPSPLFLDTAAPLWSSQNAQAAASLNQGGSLETESSVQGDNENHTWVFMNPAASFWQENLVQVVSTLAAHNVDVAQLDGWPISGMPDDYSPGHPSGEGGSWQTAALSAILSNMRAAITGLGSRMALTSEEISEIFIPYLDLYTNRDLMAEAEGVQWGAQYAGEPVPLFPYVYKPYAQAESSYWPGASSSNASYDYLAYARALTWGQIPVFLAGISLADNSLSPNVLSYYREVGHALNTYSRFLRHGSILPPPQIASPTTAIALNSGWGSPWSGTALSIQASAWRSRGGETGVVLTNISDSPISFTVPIDFTRWGLTPGLNYSITWNPDSGRELIDSSVSGATPVSVTLQPRQIGFLVITPPAPASCTYTLDLAGQGFPATGGAGTISISTAAGCPWNVGNLPSWITPTSPASGFGSGTITFRVGPNSGGDLSCSLSLGGQTFTVQETSASFPGLASAGSLAQVASEGTWDFRLDAINLGTSSAQARFAFLDNNGHALAIPLTFPQMNGASAPLLASTLDQTLNSNAGLILESTGPATAGLVGWGQLLSNGGVTGFGTFSNATLGWNAVVPLETRNANSYVLPFDNTGPLATGVAIANVAAQAADVPVIIRDDAGTEILPTALTLAAQGHTSFMLNQQYPVTAGKRGTVEFETPQGGQISVLGLRASGPALTTLPVLANVGAGGGSIAHVTYNGGFTSTFYLVNTGSSSANFTLSFFDEAGHSLAIPLSLPQTGTTSTTPALTNTLAAGAMLVITTQAQDALASISGSAQLTTTGNISGFEVFRWTTFGQEASVPLETRTPHSFVLVFDDTNGLTTGVALANLSNSEADVTVNLRDDTGAALETTTIHLAARGHTSFMLPTSYGSAANRRGMAEFVAPAGGQISVIGLRAKSDGTLTTIPVLTR